jgi:hypothetical protein
VYLVHGLTRSYFTRKMTGYLDYTDRPWRLEPMGPEPEAHPTAAAAGWVVRRSARRSSRCNTGSSPSRLRVFSMGMTEELAIWHYFKRLTAIQHEFGSTDFHRSRYAALTRRGADPRATRNSPGRDTSTPARGVRHPEQGRTADDRARIPPHRSSGLWIIPA